MITVDEIHDVLDQDMDIHNVVAFWVNRAKTYDVISFSNYRELRVRHQGWKPVGLDEYRAQLKGDRAAVKRIRDENKRRLHNNRVQDAIEASNPFNTIA